ncbi:DnaJ domain-containing protein [Neohortaea acidophila]|uniref:DnaJ domain-containing protein n=1 Tax=Neohortaea acidophila TaxID=245834 RepID=A0A6A6Q6V9_9PEZI|nr:DnaJ domain-containing protein [Neohortaea acidophila]KAF2488022.1 DnaJ domain-containing protein [Neohortaea acidophila]
MATIQLTATLPSLPDGWSAEKDFKPIDHLSAPISRAIEPVGPHFLAHARRKRHKRTFSEDERIQAQQTVAKAQEEDPGDISEDEDPALLAREAKDWKTQDHYAVLGLSKYRYRATEDQIKRAHRKKVLKHHPDKKAASGREEGDQFFKCIQRATDILLDPVKRRQFDSVDEEANIEPPTKKEVQKKPNNFYKLWGAVFVSEGRFSVKYPLKDVPKIGDANSSKEHVEEFYNFWYNFDSWRSFEYLDEDVPDDNENRDQKRHMERKNNNARKKRKTEDTQRLRKLVDDCLAMDERIKRFRQEGNKAKNQKKAEKEAAEQAAKEEAAKKKAEDERLQKEKEEADKAMKEEGKKAKEAAKNAAKKNKRVIRGAIKDANYFADGDADAKTIDGTLNDVDALILKLDNEEVALLSSNLNGKDKTGAKVVFQEQVKTLVDAGKVKEGELKWLA